MFRSSAQQNSIHWWRKVGNQFFHCTQVAYMFPKQQIRRDAAHELHGSIRKSPVLYREPRQATRFLEVDHPPGRDPCKDIS